MFSISQFTLYRNSYGYSTLTGGIFSILIIGVLLTIFVSMAITTFSYSDVTSSSRYIS
jgi:hypothetical protein